MEVVATVRKPNETSASVASRREAILDVVTDALAQQGSKVVEVDTLIEQSGITKQDVEAEFPTNGDLLVALAERAASSVSKPLLAEAPLPEEGMESTRARLTEFGTELQHIYSSYMVGLIRAAMTEGSRHKELRSRIYEKGPGAITRALSEFLEREQEAGRIDTDHCELAAEQLIGMLREPLYQEVALHSQGLIDNGDASKATYAAIDLFLKGCRVEGSRT